MQTARKQELPHLRPAEATQAGVDLGRARGWWGEAEGRDALIGQGQTRLLARQDRGIRAIFSPLKNNESRIRAFSPPWVCSWNRCVWATCSSI